MGWNVGGEAACRRENHRLVGREVFSLWRLWSSAKIIAFAQFQHGTFLKLSERGSSDRNQLVSWFWRPLLLMILNRLWFVTEKRVKVNSTFYQLILDRERMCFPGGRPNWKAVAFSHPHSIWYRTLEIFLWIVLTSKFHPNQALTLMLWLLLCGPYYLMPNCPISKRWSYEFFGKIWSKIWRRCHAFQMRRLKTMNEKRQEKNIQT